MFRYRRYRVFLVFALVVVFSLYKFGNAGDSWKDVATNAAGLVKGAEHALQNNRPLPPSPPARARETMSLKLPIPVASSPQPLQTPPPLKGHIQKPAISEPSPPPSPPEPSPAPSSSSIEIVHWTKLSEQFPVPSKSLITLPSGKSNPIPKIQFAFKPESDAARVDRLAKLDTIRTVFKKSWKGYRENAWLHDELKPVSGEFDDPFAYWGATLVDALDTLWIMGLKDEFEEAAKAVDKIDFTTTPRPDIPLFETTIRYLGGLLAAYDISDRKYKNLLTKAVELGELLISAFDTPNRMPEAYYYWRSPFASQKHRATSRMVLAEIGSLSMEFTRLAQLTGEHKYYDAVARITDNLEEFQNKTRLPGMWPTHIDASGCGEGYPDPSSELPLHTPEVLPSDNSADEPVPDKSVSSENISPDVKDFVPLKLPNPIVLINERSTENKNSRANHFLRIRQLDTDRSEIVSDGNKTPSTDTASSTDPDCIPQGFISSSSQYGSDEFSLGGTSDSTYEYLSKQYLLLGGQVEKYQTMYEQSMDAVKKHLIFRPIVPKNDDILFCGKFVVPSSRDKPTVGHLIGENQHLTCFAGGMLGMGAKIFNRPEDLEIAKKLTEGCVWSYDMTVSGIMPESFNIEPCESIKGCEWNETAYWEILDPNSEFRFQNYEEQLELYEQQLASASSWYEAQLAAITPPSRADSNPDLGAKITPTPLQVDPLDKRQLAQEAVDPNAATIPSLIPTNKKDTGSSPNGQLAESEIPPTRVQPSFDSKNAVPQPNPALPAFPRLYSPSPPLSHKEYVQSRIEEEGLPPGVTGIGGRNYILR